MAADDCFEVWLSVVEVFGGGNDGPLGPVVLLVLVLDGAAATAAAEAVPAAPSAVAEDFSIIMSESCGVCRVCMSTGVATKVVKNGD